MTKKELESKIAQLEEELEESRDELKFRDLDKDLKRAVNTVSAMIEAFVNSGLTYDQAIDITKSLFECGTRF